MNRNRTELSAVLLISIMYVYIYKLFIGRRNVTVLIASYDIRREYKFGGTLSLLSCDSTISNTFMHSLL